MDNEWLNNLRTKMEDHHEDVPDGLWDDIKDELFFEKDENAVLLGSEEKLSDVKNNKSSIAGTWPLLYRISGVAAAAAIFFILGNQLFKIYKGKNSVQEIVCTEKKHSVERIDNSFDNKEALINDPEMMSADVYFKQERKLNISTSARVIELIKSPFVSNVFKEKSRNIKINDNLILENHFYNLNQEKLMVHDYDVPNADSQPVNEMKETHELLSKEERKLRDKYAANEMSKKGKHQYRKPWMASILTGEASPDAAQQFPGYTSLSGQPMVINDMWQSSGFEDDPLREILVANQNKEVKADIKHKVPVTLGVSLYHNLGKKWGVGTGVRYTKLSSELRSGSSSDFIKSEQTIHYIGIPVQVNYNVIQKGCFTGYITAGALVEKAVGGSVKTKYVVDGEVTDGVKEDLEVKPIQVSVNTAVGLQLKIVSKIGIYAEPGIGYHFKDNSSLNTIYKEKPLNFNMNFGIRLLID
ncbi:hypothetical protein M2347_001433 [Chryseobacterium sp. H1D6B]|uniref:outer membrane beta-barrel protein n=1 Tax=Chryseobacterium sp. H1D6B TaxID=2940588 RepID=UPI0015C99DD0|nr:outer membrane beta-barrel protein [Chryseobacterium sp. H1D6B]MDH6251706.1 hypothetical protein [Chryseobacterium sp. H1D6B]